MTDDEVALLPRFMISKMIKMMMIAIAISESRMIPHGCSYQATALLLFVGCPFSPGVKVDDGL